MIIHKLKSPYFLAAVFAAIVAVPFFTLVPRGSLLGDYVFNRNPEEKRCTTEQQAFAVPVENPAKPQEPQHVRTKPEEKEIKGIYLTSWSASQDKTIDHFIAVADKTELNAFVIDIKDYSGKIAYDSAIEEVVKFGTEEVRIKNLKELLDKLHEHGVYAIARQTVFQDPALSAANPSWAVKNSSTGGVWKDYKGLGWLDPTREEVWEYNVAIAKEAIGLGFDEVQFDYIRFPSDGPISLMRFANLNDRKKSEVLANFFKYLHENLKDEPAYISVDLFGLTTERTDDMNIGQQIEDAAPYVDYISPMVYPSHYPKGYMNYENPASHPYEVVKHAIAKGVESIGTVENKKAKIRPWLQDFDMGADYNAAMVRKQITASDEAGGYGWLIWNARNVYSEAVFGKNN